MMSDVRKWLRPETGSVSRKATAPAVLFFFVVKQFDMPRPTTYRARRRRGKVLRQNRTLRRCGVRHLLPKLPWHGFSR